MPFLTTSDIASSLPAGYDSALVDRLLIRLESDLTDRGFVFDAPSVETRAFYPTNYAQTLFDLPNASAITTVKAKAYVSGASESTLSVSTNDYLLTEHPAAPGYYYRITTTLSFSYPNYVEITGKFGLFVNFSDNNDKIAKLLKSAIIDFVINQVKYSTNSSSAVPRTKRAKTADASEIEFFESGYVGSSGQGASSSAFDDPSFAAVLNKFNIW